MAAASHEEIARAVDEGVHAGVADPPCLVCHGGNEDATYEFSAKPLGEMWKEEWLVKGCLSTEEANRFYHGLTHRSVEGDEILFRQGRFNDRLFFVAPEIYLRASLMANMNCS